MSRKRPKNSRRVREISLVGEEESMVERIPGFVDREIFGWSEIMKNCEKIRVAIMNTMWRV